MPRKITTTQAIHQLEEFGFTKRADTLGEYAPNADIYIRKIDTERYIVISHYHQKKTEELQAFDCWIGTYRFEYHIGRVAAIEIEEVKLDFDFAGDWKLIKKHLFD